jgi:hypothetical protein
LISEISANNFDVKFLQVLKNVVTGVDCSKLTLGDRMYLALWLTINSYGKDSTVEYEINASSIGGRTYFEDGMWQFIWTVSGTVSNPDPVPFEATGNSASYFTCNSECCVSELLAKIDMTNVQCCNNKSTEYVEDYLKANVLLQGLKNAAFCGNITMFNNIKKVLDKICKKTDCKTCN